MLSTAITDRAAIALSSACVVHCVVLPALAVVAPFAGAVAEVEWIHWVLACFAILAAASVAIRAPSARCQRFLVPAGMGCALILFGIFAEQFGVGETLPTVLGGLLLAAAHLTRIKQNHTYGRTPTP